MRFFHPRKLKWGLRESHQNGFNYIYSSIYITRGWVTPATKLKKANLSLCKWACYYCKWAPQDTVLYLQLTQATHPFHPSDPSNPSCVIQHLNSLSKNGQSPLSALSYILAMSPWFFPIHSCLQELPNIANPNHRRNTKKATTWYHMIKEVLSYNVAKLVQMRGPSKLLLLRLSQPFPNSETSKFHKQTCHAFGFELGT